MRAESVDRITNSASFKLEEGGRIPRRSPSPKILEWIFRTAEMHRPRLFLARGILNEYSTSSILQALMIDARL